MSLENAERLANLLQSNAANVSSSEWRPQQQDDANDLLIKGAEVAAAQETLNLSDEETIELLMREADAEDRKAIGNRYDFERIQRMDDMREGTYKRKAWEQKVEKKYPNRDDLEKAVEAKLPAAFRDAPDRSGELEDAMGLTEESFQAGIAGEDLGVAAEAAERRKSKLGNEPLMRDETPEMIRLEVNPATGRPMMPLGRNGEPISDRFAVQFEDGGDFFFDPSSRVVTKRRGFFRPPSVRVERPKSQRVDQAGGFFSISPDEARRLAQNDRNEGLRLVEAERAARFSDPQVLDLANAILDGKGTVAVDTSGVEVVSDPYVSGIAVDRAGNAIGSSTDAVILNTQAPLDPLAGSNTPTSSQALNAPDVASMDADSYVKEMFSQIEDPRVDITGTEQDLIQRLNGYGQQNNIDFGGITSGPMTQEKFRQAVSLINAKQQAQGGVFRQDGKQRLSITPGAGTALHDALGMTIGQQQAVASMLVNQEATRASGVDADAKARYFAGEGFRPAPRNLVTGVNIHAGYASGDMDSDAQVGGMESAGGSPKAQKTNQSRFRRAASILKGMGIDTGADEGTVKNVAGAVAGEPTPVNRRPPVGQAQTSDEVISFYENKREQQGGLSEKQEENMRNIHDSLVRLERAERDREEGRAITPRPPRSGPTVTGPASQAAEARERFETLRGPASDDMANRELVREIKSRRRR